MVSGVRCQVIFKDEHEHEYEDDRLFSSPNSFSSSFSSSGVVQKILLTPET